MRYIGLDVHGKATVFCVLLGGPLTFTAKENRYHIAGQVGAGWMELVEGAPCS